MASIDRNTSIIVYEHFDTLIKDRTNYIFIKGRSLEQIVYTELLWRRNCVKKRL